MFQRATWWVSWSSQWTMWTFSGVTSCSRELLDDVSWSSQWAVWTFNEMTSCSRELLDDVSWSSQWTVWRFNGITSCCREVFDDVSWSSQWTFRWEQWDSEPLRALILILFITLNLHPYVLILKRYKSSDNDYSGLHFPKRHVYKKYILCLWKICYLNVLCTFQIAMVLFLSCSETLVPELHPVWCLDYRSHWSPDGPGTSETMSRQFAVWLTSCLLLHMELVVGIHHKVPVLFLQPIFSYEIYPGCQKWRSEFSM